MAFTVLDCENMLNNSQLIQYFTSKSVMQARKRLNLVFAKALAQFTIPTELKHVKLKCRALF